MGFYTMDDKDAHAAQDQIDISKFQSLVADASGPALKEMRRQIIEIDRDMKKHVRPIIEKEIK